MKVTLINNSDHGGGAPLACLRLMKALRASKTEARMLVQEKATSIVEVDAVNTSLWGKLKKSYNFLRERLLFIFFNEKDKTVRFAFSSASTGTNIANVPAIRSADILHLHWTNRGYLSIKNLRQLANLGKPVIWTLHDMWAFTGGCHYAADCTHYTQSCGHCWMLRQPESLDISHKGWLRKMHLFSDPSQFVFVTCSNWLGREAQMSSLLKGYRIETIPNPIDVDIFKPDDKTALRQKWNILTDKKIILFGAANIMDRRKGIAYLTEALTILRENNVLGDEVEIVVFGKNKEFDLSTLPFKAHELGIISSQTDIAGIYSLADVYVSPAVEDNLPNTIMEALACGTPVVAFNTGGIPDMVVHRQNGYLAEFKSAKDFAEGISFVLNVADASALSLSARQKVLDNFTNEKVAAQYEALYQSVLADA